MPLCVSQPRIRSFFQWRQETLHRFRVILTEEGLIRKRDDDNSLLRFLRARGFNIAKAKAMFEAMLEWRKEIGADTIKQVKRSPVFFPLPDVCRLP
jgi:hypothetical protein